MTQWNKYGPTAARRHGRPGREARPKSTTIDVHSHVGVRRADYEPPSNGVLKLDRDWNVTASVGFGAKDDPVFNAVHDLAIGLDGSIYIAETRTKRVVKLRPVHPPSP